MAANSATPESPIRALSIRVLTGRLVCEVQVDRPELRTTGPRLAEELCRRFPDLPHHHCVNDVGPAFGDVMARTSLPHMLEHLAIAFALQAAPDPDTAFTGTSQWVNEAAGLARIQLSFQDDLDGLCAFDSALTFLNHAVLACMP